MILLSFILILMVGGLLAWISARFNRKLPRTIALAATLADLVLAVVFWMQSGSTSSVSDSLWLRTFSVPWIPTFGVSFSLAIDGLSLLMLLLTFFLAVLAVLTSWKEIEYRVGFYYFNLLW